MPSRRGRSRPPTKIISPLADGDAEGRFIPAHAGQLGSVASLKYLVVRRPWALSKPAGFNTAGQDPFAIEDAGAVLAKSARGRSLPGAWGRPKLPDRGYSRAGLELTKEGMAHASPRRGTVRSPPE
jgi:hypothetical protein